MDEHQVPDKSKHELTGTTQVGNLDYPLAAILCYLPVPLIGLLASVVFVATEPKSNFFVRFHAVQSLMLAGVALALNIAVGIVGSLSGIPMIGWLFGVISGIAGFLIMGGWFIVSIMLVLKAKERELYKLPVIGDLAEQYAR